MRVFIELACAVSSEHLDRITSAPEVTSTAEVSELALDYKNIEKYKIRILSYVAQKKGLQQGIL